MNCSLLPGERTAGAGRGDRRESPFPIETWKSRPLLCKNRQRGGRQPSSEARVVSVVYSLLHISDLHRSEADPIGNEELLSTLLADLDRYTREDPAVPAPNAVVLSGDVIQGARLHKADHLDELDREYEVALDFLDKLTTEFIDGDRSRVIIVPGNHDVDWNTARSAMVPLPQDEMPPTLGPVTFGPDAELRWGWEERLAYRIDDRDLYEERFAAFYRFVGAFYDGVELLMKPSPDAYYWLAELFDGRMGIAAFNSCFGNDCFSFHGAIPEKALAQAHMDLRSRGDRHDLRMAVWHHNVEGAPYASDYMDVGTIYRLIGKGFRLGLHGHQHRAEATRRYLHLPGEEPMALVSAGSLCAGGRALPTGVNRQYNIIELTDELDRARVHVREMAVATAFAPARRAEFAWHSYVDLDLGHPRTGETRRARNQAATLAAERALRQGQLDEAVHLLTEFERPPGSYARALMVSALEAAKEWPDLVREIADPQTVEECVTLVHALGELGDIRAARDGLTRCCDAFPMPAGIARDLESWLNAREWLG